MLQPLLYVPFSNGSSPLLTDLVAYWKLDEASGTRFDSVGSNDLTDNNTVGSATGRIGNAASFVAANIEYLSRASTADVQASGNFTFAAWIKPASIGNRMGVVNKGTTGAEYILWIDTTGQIKFALSANFTNRAETPSAISTTEWWLVVASYDGTPRLWVRSESGTLLTDDGNATGHSIGAADYEVGHYEVAGTPYPFNGLIDEVGFWKRVLTPAERTTLWNGGSGITYPF